MVCHPECLEFDCECGKLLHVRRVTVDGKWYAQHGDNPEHRSRFFDNREMFLSGTREWRERIHARG